MPTRSDLTPQVRATMRTEYSHGTRPKDLQERFHVSEPTFYNIVKGAPKPERRNGSRVAQALGVVAQEDKDAPNRYLVTVVREIVIVANTPLEAIDAAEQAEGVIDVMGLQLL